MKITTLIVVALVVSACSSCAKFNINEAAGNSHKCPSKHARRVHSYGGKLYYNCIPEQKSPQNAGSLCSAN